MTIDQFLQEKGIPTTDSSHHHVQAGWIGIDCPWCGERGKFHMGINLSNGACSCWLCGKHQLFDVFKRLGFTGKDLQKFKKTVDFDKANKIPATQKVYKNENLIYPPDIQSMKKHHKRYLIERNFDPDYLEYKYGLQGIGPAGGKFSNRILIPVFYKNTPVTYQARDITNKKDEKYRNCAKINEVRSIKHCLYGIEDCANLSRVVIVEGASDVWRLGKGAVATFSVNWNPTQAKMLKDKKEVFILYDSGEVAAMKQAKKLANFMETLNVSATVIDHGFGDIDPGDLSNEQANDIMKELGIVI